MGVPEALKSALLGSGQDQLKKSPSFDDFSMGAGSDAQEHYSKEGQERQALAREQGSTLEGAKESLKGAAADVAQEEPSPRKTNVWASTFNPGRNMSQSYRQRVNNNYFDTMPDKTGESTIWDMILKGERLRIFQTFDRDNDGFIDAGDLMYRLGNQEEVRQLIQAADKNGDGRLDYNEFVELLRNS